MFYLLLLFSFIAVAAGVFVVGFGVPIRETPFGAGLLTVGSVAITGGFILVGLAAAVRELERVVQGLKARVPGVPRPLRPMERKDGERKDGADKRPGPPRMPMPGRPGPDAPNPMPTNLDAPDTPPPGPARKPGPEWLRRAVAEIEAAPKSAEAAPGGPGGYRADAGRPPPPDVWPRSNLPAPEHAVPEVRGAPAAASQNIFDMVWPLDRRRAEGAPEKRHEAPPEPAMRPLEARPAPVAPAPPQAPLPVAPAPAPPVRAEQRPLSILKSGVIDEMAYTLFTDGSIEAQMPDGTMRFASIDELRQHLEKHEG
jgi:hypothetical protein